MQDLSKTNHGQANSQSIQKDVVSNQVSLESKRKGLKMSPMAFLHALWTLQALSNTDWEADKDTRISGYGFIVYFVAFQLHGKAKV